jgi:processive 1,2-diacylglycerol beta-glucosyltransferase
MTWVLDLKECARGVWIAHRSQSIACFTDEVADQAKRFGIPSGRVHLVAAPLELAGDQRATMTAACVTKHERPGPPIVVVVFGASGADRMLDYAMELQKLSAVSLIYVCGRHLDLKARLEARIGASATVLGFVADMQELYAQASVVVSKPGAMTIWEALGNSVPLVLELNWSTPVQERYQARWAERHGLAVTFRSPRALCRAVRAALNRTHAGFHEAKTQIGWREGEDCCTALVQWVQRAGARFQ